MISYQSIEINEKKSYGQLLDSCCISDKHIDSMVVDFLGKYLGDLISKVIIEWPYYDQDYLSIYYIHYSKKFKNYPKYCYRLHFISRRGEYCGCTVLRPIIIGKKMGKTYIKPELLLKERAYLVRGEYNVHIDGMEELVDAFPWMMQDTDITTCAHIAVWSVLRYYGNRFVNYSCPTLGEIVENVHEEWGRKTPSVGLTPIQVAEILSRYGFYPIIRGGNKNKTDLLLEETFAYIESGIPIIAMCESKQHAFSVIGHGEIKKDILDNDEYVNKIREPETNIILHSKLINSIYVMDDNCFPYRRVDKYIDSESDVPYSMYEISYVVVPLYARMQLEYHEVYNRFIGLVKYGGMKWEGTRIVRIYLTSSDLLKNYAKLQENMSSILKNIIIHLNMSKYVWCIDTSDVEEYKEGKVSGKVIIDATAGTKDGEPWLLMHDKGEVRFYDVLKDTNEIIKNINIEPYAEYAHNLDCIEVYNKEEMR